MDEAAERAASEAWRAAGMHCSAPQVPGTSSTLLVEVGAVIERSRGAAEASGSGRTHSSCESGMVRAMRLDVDVTRRLSSFKLHTPGWGTASQPPVAQELVMRPGGLADVRMLGVLAMLADRARAPGEGPSSSTSSGPRLVLQLLGRRCKELLSVFPTTLADDERALQQQAGSDVATTLQFRIGKKRALLGCLRTLEEQYHTC